MVVGLCRWIHPASGHRCVLGLVHIGIYSETLRQKQKKKYFFRFALQCLDNPSFFNFKRSVSIFCVLKIIFKKYLSRIGKVNFECYFPIIGTLQMFIPNL